MLGFAAKPDPAFAALVAVSLEFEIDQLRDPDAPDDDVLANYSPQTRTIFTRAEVLALLEKLLAAHRSETIYTLTDYHFLVLHDVLRVQADLHNDSLDLHGGVRRYGDVVLRKIDLDAALGIYFFDTDFLFEPEHFNAMSPENKEELSFADETWGVVNRLKPHADELVLREATPEFIADYRVDQEGIYEPGEDYPVLRDPDDEDA